MTADPYTACTNSMSTDQTPTADDILAACKKFKEADDDHQHCMTQSAHLIQCEFCKPAAIWKKNTLWLCPHYLRAVKELPKDSRELSISEHMAVDVGGLRIGAIQSPEFVQAVYDETRIAHVY